MLQTKWSSRIFSMFKAFSQIKKVIFKCIENTRICLRFGKIIAQNYISFYDSFRVCSAMLGYYQTFLNRVSLCTTIEFCKIECPKSITTALYFMNNCRWSHTTSAHQYYTLKSAIYKQLSSFHHPRGQPAVSQKKIVN